MKTDTQTEIPRTCPRIAPRRLFVFQSVRLFGVSLSASVVLILLDTVFLLEGGEGVDVFSKLFIKGTLRDESLKDVLVAHFVPTTFRRPLVSMCSFNLI